MSLLPHLRIPRPLCTCGWPKTSSRSQRASKHSTHSFLGNSRRRRMTAGSMAKSLLKHLPKLSGGYRSKLFAAFQPPITLLDGFFQGGHLLGQSAVFPLRVIRGLDLDSPQRDDIGAANNADILAPRRSGEPAF